MMSPNTMVFRVGGMKSLNSMFLKPFSRNKRREIGSDNVLVIQPMKMPQNSDASVSRGSMRTQARTLVATRNL